MILLLALQLVCPSQAQPVKVETLNPNIATGIVFSFRKSGIPAPKGDYPVEGDTRLTIPILSARKLFFKKGSRLVLDPSSNNSSQSFSFGPWTVGGTQGPPQFVLIVEDIEVEDATDPGTITWDPGPPPPPPFYPSSGSAGGSGSPGARGLPGRSAPSLTIIAGHVGGMPKIALCGQPGGDGGIGQAGGPGQRGANGDSASQNAFNCNRGAGNGGQGGPGGNGGNGGDGGLGGDGGSFMLLTTRQDQHFENGPYLDGGNGGKGGVGGGGGPGGSGGEGGSEQMPYCRGNGQRGPNGPRGADGNPGGDGGKGKQGTVSVGLIDQSQFQVLLKSAF